MRLIADLQPLICKPEASVRYAMAQLTALSAGTQFQVVVDQAGRVAGTLTDGDLRRAILSGAGLDDPVGPCANAAPQLGRVGAHVENERRLRALRGGVATAFLPIIDANGVLSAVLVDGSDTPPFAALVMAGGFGRRLGERTRNTPKPLLPVGGKPILGHILDRLERAGAEQIYISVHYLADQIADFVKRRDNACIVELVAEEAPLGTAGALGLFRPPEEAPLLTLNGDVLTGVDLANVLSYHLERGLDGTIAVALHEVTIPFGVVESDGDGRFTRIVEKPTVSSFVSAGINVLNAPCRALVRPGERLDMPDLLARCAGAGCAMGVFPIHEYWTDVGRAQDLERADQEFSDGEATS